MKYEARWLLLVLCAGCGSLPDWSDVQQKLAIKNSAAGSNSAEGGGAGMDTDTGSAGSVAVAGGAGQAAVAGAAGSGNTSMGGSGGMPNVVAGAAGMMAQAGAAGAAMTQDQIDKAELTNALSMLNGFVYTNPCKFSNNGSDVTTLNNCNTSDICWATQGLGEFSEKRQIMIGGTAGHVYQIDLNVLGVIEPRDYPPPPNCMRLPGQPADTAGISTCADGFANKSDVQFNVWEFSVPAPAKKYYFNSVPVHPPHRVDLIDNKFTFQVTAGSTITFTMDDLNGGEIRNCSSKITTSKYKTVGGATITASTTVQQPYNGNWFQLTVLDATVMH